MRLVEDVFCEFMLRVVVRVFVCGLNGELCFGVVEVGDGMLELVLELLWLEVVDMVFGFMGMVRFWRFELDVDVGGGGCGIRFGLGGLFVVGIGSL